MEHRLLFRSLFLTSFSMTIVSPAFSMYLWRIRDNARIFPLRAEKIDMMIELNQAWEGSGIVDDALVRYDSKRKPMTRRTYGTNSTGDIPFEEKIRREKKSYRRHPGRRSKREVVPIVRESTDFATHCVEWAHWSFRRDSNWNSDSSRKKEKIRNRNQCHTRTYWISSSKNEN